MKTLILAILTLFSFVPVHSASGMVPPLSCVFRQHKDKPVDMAKLYDLMETYRIRRTAGIGLMSGGAAALVAGEVMTILSAVRAESGPYRRSTEDPLWIAGFSATMVGAGGLASGLPLFLIYNKRYKAVKHRIKKLSEGKEGIIIER